MKANDIVKTALSFMIFVIFHVLIVKYFVIGSVGLCFFYLGFLLTLSLSIPIPLLLLISFLVGFFVDLFYDTPGIHTFASVAIMFLRPKIITLLTPLGGYDEIDEITISSMGVRWFITYTLILLVFHTLIVFLMEASGFSYFHWTLSKVFCTTIFTTFMICSFQYLLFTPKS
ncbi:MAG: Rod shape-determining protein MreD [Bacteroidetes bacterium]|nr:MAG: Rod shape-determining protein MreD [Bacteroidota bacterium]